MTVTKERVRIGLREGMLVHCAHVRKSACLAIHVVGAQNCSLGMHGVPLVTLWPLFAHVQRTVSPTTMSTMRGVKVKPCPTETSKIVLVGDATPLAAFQPF